MQLNGLISWRLVFAIAFGALSAGFLYELGSLLAAFQVNDLLTFATITVIALGLVILTWLIAVPDTDTRPEEFFDEL